MSKLYPVLQSSIFSPQSDVFSMMRSFDRNFDNLFNTSSSKRSSSLMTVPRANVMRSDNGYTIMLAAPGFSKDEFILSVENGVLSVSVDTEDTQTQIENTTVQEFSFQSFKRSWTLPEAVSSERISARYDAGVLYIDVPTEEKRETKLTINVE